MKKTKLNEGALEDFFYHFFGALGIDKVIAKKIINEPEVKKQIMNVRRSAKIVKRNAERWKNQNK